MTEKRTVYKWIWVWDFEKEEQWLNEMAMEGWALMDVGFCRYVFEKTDPGEYIIRLELHGGDEGYISFMKETGAELVGRLFAWVYFRRKSALGAFDLFSDIDSRITHLDRIGKMLSIIGMVNLFLGVINSVNPGAKLGWINLLCATLLMYALGRIHGKKESLEKERIVRE